MEISIIVPAFNEEKLIGESLRSIQRASVAFAERGWKAELIVCDNNSTDRTAVLAADAGAKVVFEPVNQIARARNTGARAASGAWLVFVDADSHPSAGLFRDVAAQIETGRCLAGGSTVQFDERHLWGGVLAKVWNLLSQILSLAAGSFIFCEAAAFREIGGFNLDLFASEEIDFSWRIKKRARRTGQRLVILHRHPLRTSARKLHLYSTWEYLRFLARALSQPRRTIKSRTDCPMWYDGRR